MINSGIYRIRNLINFKVYIGSASNTKQRWRAHRYLLYRNSHHSKHLQAAWNKYGEAAFEFSIIEIVVLNKDKLSERETFWINQTKANNNEYGYNGTANGNNSLGVKFSEEHKKKLSLAKIGKPNLHSRNIIKWPHEKGSLCRCEECRQQLRTQTNIRYRNSKDDVGEYRKFDKWPHEDGWKCKCEECREKWREYKRQRYARLKMRDMVE